VNSHAMQFNEEDEDGGVYGVEVLEHACSKQGKLGRRKVLLWSATVRVGILGPVGFESHLDMGKPDADVMVQVTHFDAKKIKFKPTKLKFDVLTLASASFLEGLSEYAFHKVYKELTEDYGTCMPVANAVSSAVASFITESCAARVAA
jgi:hypothetical protein